MLVLDGGRSKVFSDVYTTFSIQYVMLAYVMHVWFSKGCTQRNRSVQWLWDG